MTYTEADKIARDTLVQSRKASDVARKLRKAVDVEAISLRNSVECGMGDHCIASAGRQLVCSENSYRDANDTAESLMVDYHAACVFREATSRASLV
jgi:hypothetical protein